MTTTLERFYTMNGIGFGDTYFETNGDLGVYLVAAAKTRRDTRTGGSRSSCSMSTTATALCPWTHAVLDPSIKVLNAAIAHMTTARDELRRLGGGR